MWGHLAFVERVESVVMLGHGGVGKAYIALALCQRPVMAWPKARFNTAADLMMQLTAAEAQNRQKEYFNRVVLDPSCSWSTRSITCPSGGTKNRTCRWRRASLARLEQGIAIETPSHCHRLWAQPIGRSHRPVRTVS